MGENSERKAWMGLLARAPAGEVDRLWRALGLLPDHALLRAPEVGAVMVRGRAGATGAPFNVGEMVVTRCAVRLGDGRVGHGHVQGRGKDHARHAALIDALMQGGEAERLRARCSSAGGGRGGAARKRGRARRRRRRWSSSRWCGGRIDGRGIARRWIFRCAGGGRAGVSRGDAGDGAARHAGAVAGAAPPAPMSVAAGVAVLVLCDAGTPVHLAGAHECRAVRDWIAFHTGAPVGTRGEAMFALGTWAALGPPGAYPAGEPEFPDRSATLIVEMERLEARGARLTGPGIKGEAALSLPEERRFRPTRRGFRWGSISFSVAVTGWPGCRAARAWRRADVCGGEGRRAGDRRGA